MFNAATRKNVRRPANTGHIQSMPAASSGMNARDMFTAMKPTDAIILKNLLVEPYGLVVREGTAEFAINIPAEGLEGSIKSLLSYYPATSTFLQVAAVPTRADEDSVISRAGPVSSGKVFAATGGLLWDISAGGSGPWSSEGGVGSAGGSDYWTGWNFSNAGGNFLTITNNDDGGYYVYNGTAWTEVTEDTSTPAGAGKIYGVNPEKFCYHFAFKQRLYFIEKNSTRMWYLPPDQITGDAKVWDFGAMFKRGGQLQMIASWTQDAGESIDDYFVAVSSAGDMVIYKGYDPDGAPDTWALHGIWSVGELPAGYRIWDAVGGDTMLLTQYGIIAVSAILQGRGEDQSLRITDKIDPLLGRYMRSNASREGWAIRHIPRQEMLLIDQPPDTTVQPTVHTQFAFKTITRGWSVLNGIDSRSWLNHGPDIFHGRPDGKVMRTFIGTVDNVKMSDGTGTPIEGQWVTSYQPLGSKGNTKRFTMIRPSLIGRGNIDLKVATLVNYGQLKQPAEPALPTLNYSFWDVSLWDSATWTAEAQPIFQWLGTDGEGYVAAAQIDFTAPGGVTRFAQLDWWVVPGGPLA